MLRKPWQFEFVYEHGRKVVGKHLVLFYCAPPDDVSTGGDGLHVGVVASKRVGSAVRRNRAKRLLREAARSLADRMNDRNIWIVVVARSGISEESAGSVEDDLRQALESAGLLGRQ